MGLGVASGKIDNVHLANSLRPRVLCRRRDESAAGHRGCGLRHRQPAIKAHRYLRGEGPQRPIPGRGGEAEGTTADVGGGQSVPAAPPALTIPETSATLIAMHGSVQLRWSCLVLAP